VNPSFRRQRELPDRWKWKTGSPQFLLIEGGGSLFQVGLQPSHRLKSNTADLKKTPAPLAFPRNRGEPKNKTRTPFGCGLGCTTNCGSVERAEVSSLRTLAEPLLFVLAEHFVKDNGVQVDTPVFGWGVVTTGPGSHAHLFNSVDIE
jgi:hypothetical protein